MKKSNQRKSQKRKVHINRINKLMRKTRRNKRRKKTNVSYYKKREYIPVSDEYISNKVIKLLEKKKFSESIFKKGNKVKIKIPEVFCFIENSDETIRTLKYIYYCCMNPKIKELKLDYSQCKKLSLGAACVTDIISLNVLKHREKMNNPLLYF